MYAKRELSLKAYLLHQDPRKMADEKARQDAVNHDKEESARALDNTATEQ